VKVAVEPDARRGSGNFDCDRGRSGIRGPVPRVVPSVMVVVSPADAEASTAG
jgi:hypothetical protein